MASPLFFIQVYAYVNDCVVAVVGLFLHVGYSVTERHLVETLSLLRWRIESVRLKLTSLLNADATPHVIYLPLSLTVGCISVGAQLTLWRQAIFARKSMYERLHQLPEYYTTFARKILFLPSLGGGRARALPTPPRLLRLWLDVSLICRVSMMSRVGLGFKNWILRTI